MQPPPIWITYTLALLYLMQIARRGELGVRLLAARAGRLKAPNLRRRTFNAWIISTMLVASICVLDPAVLPNWEPVIGGMRAQIVTVLVVLLIGYEPLLRSAQFHDVRRLIIIAEQSTDPEIIANAGRLLEVHELYDFAIEAYERAIGLSPDPTDEYVSIAVLYGTLSRFADAERAARQAISLAPESSAAHLYLGMAVYMQDRYHEASGILNKAISWGGLPDSLERIGRSALERIENEHDR